MKLLTVTEVGQVLGFSRSKIYKLVKEDDSFPRAIKLGESDNAPVRFDQDEIEQWIREHKL